MFEWTPECQAAWQALKDTLVMAPVLVMYKPELPLSLHTDASSLDLGVLLYQGQGKDKHVLTYSSRTLLPAETHYTITELEALAIVWGVEHNGHYLFGQHSQWSQTTMLCMT